MATRKKNIGYIGIVVLIALIVISFFYRLPYEVMEPGDAHNLYPVISVKGGHKYKKGEFMFMTVRIVQPNIWQYALAKVEKYHKIFPMQQLLGKGETPQEYQTYQIQLMDSAQFAATYVAYKKAGKHPQIERDGVIVVGLIKGMPAKKKLQLDDVIVKADGKPVKTPADLIQALKGKKLGDHLNLTVKRNGKTIHTTVPLGKFPARIIKEDKKQGQNPKKYGLGIQQVADIQLKVNPPVTFHTAQIGGPSGGLMFTLGIYNRLTKENWTKGYKIAGTGTMNVVKDKKTGKIVGEVGPIGGIREKVVAADKRNVEIFFAPVRGGNYKAAVQTAKDIGTKMKIVPVKTFQDALNYLKKLSPKKGSNIERNKAS